MVSPLAGKPADPSLLINIPRLVAAYYTDRPDPSIREQRVSFGTSGHRGSSFTRSFNEWHVLDRGRSPLSIAAEHRRPLFMGLVRCRSAAGTDGNGRQRGPSVRLRRR
jgi:phosphoglucomutase